MIVELEVPFADAAASHLGFLPSAPALPVLATLEQSDLVPDGHLSLRVLGASHQAVLSLPEGQYAETLACADTVDGPLPSTRSMAVGGWQVRLRVEVTQSPAATLAAACQEMRRYATREDPRHSLYASFPGHPLAVTFLQFRASDRRSGDDRRSGELRTAHWTTVHIYPESGEQVRTRTEIQRGEI